ncbi:hypothetical protein FRACYDRAFT_235321 [Fragilariopsis cylindrus CCMP1102]|uniref:Septin-type G domain-containing protein n=1 Tax=Fragilariopsis cylindrus CCMP1102 TaxID=635003 RepID=A0A1E7FM81_9STRA|nr:hypothetical protein FRACYDRAFT_235321 [Fragilariopsis cylindrus CCMP1102]|eukprot:OEU19271.1 hypothetical protein FRACYDRAFT_235321 [Fragilariopsis cylindrus CCMP1102]
MNHKIISLSIFVFLFGRRCLNVGVVVASSSPPTMMTTKSTITTDSSGSPEESSSLLSSKIPTKTMTEKSHVNYKLYHWVAGIIETKSTYCLVKYNGSGPSRDGPGRFLAIDRHFLKHVQSEVTIVPIIAKADTLTDDEIANFRAELTKIWKEESIDVYSLDDDHHNPSSIRSEQNKILNTDDDSLKRTLYRGRRPGEVLAVIARDGKYPWGNSCAFDPEHSDLKLIRDSILSDHTERFLELATEKYGIYRNQQFARQKRSDWIKYAALLGLTAIQFRKVELIRGVFSKVISLVPVPRIFSKLLLSLGIGNNTTSSPLVEDDNDDDNDDGHKVGMISDDVFSSSSSSSDRKSIFEFFGIPSFDSIRKQQTYKNE